MRQNPALFQFQFIKESEMNTLKMVASAVSCLALFLSACGGGDPQDPATLAGLPHAVAKAGKPAGASAVAVHMYQALYGKAPGYALMTDYTSQATADAGAFVKSLESAFVGTSNTNLAKLVLDNLGVTATTVKAVNAKGESEYTLLLDAVQQLFAAYPTMRGQVILNMTNLLADLEADATYGGAAVAYNNQASANHTYATNSANTNAAAVVAGGGAATVGSAIGGGLYSAVLAANNVNFLTLLNTACTSKTAISGATIYSNCTQPAAAAFSVNLTANMYLGGLPFQTGGSVESGPSSYSPRTAKVSVVQGISGVAVNDSCTVRIAEPYIPIVPVETKGVRYYATGVNFSFKGTADDSITVTSSGVVSEYTMSNGQGGKIEVHPNLALFGATQSGTEAVVGTVLNGMWTSYFMCS
ncbi:MAG: hypothetical protein D4R79_09480 [Comamonadaceae bacterium]|nr:MAG: hypothetical protein D4R79_09480 [Comamonadaceae bacterium]